MVMVGWSLALSILVQGQSLSAIATSVDPKPEVAAAKRAADAKLRILRKAIEVLRVQVQAGSAQHQAELTAAEERYVAELAARDRAYALEIAVFRKAVEDIAATLEGTAALARFNAGDEPGALTVLDRSRAAHDAARKKRADLESAVEARRIATLALEARTKGKQITAQVITRYEEVTRLDPGVPSDWGELGRLYKDAGNLPAALRAAQAAAKTATEDRDRSVAQDDIGDVLVAQGDGPGALAAYRKGLAIADGLAARDPANVQWQIDVAVSCAKLGTHAELTESERQNYLRRGLEIQQELNTSNRLAPNQNWISWFEEQLKEFDPVAPSVRQDKNKKLS